MITQETCCEQGFNQQLHDDTPRNESTLKRVTCRVVFQVNLRPFHRQQRLFPAVATSTKVVFEPTCRQGLQLEDSSFLVRLSRKNTSPHSFVTHLKTTLACSAGYIFQGSRVCTRGCRRPERVHVGCGLRWNLCIFRFVRNRGQ